VRKFLTLLKRFPIWKPFLLSEKEGICPERDGISGFPVNPLYFIIKIKG
jgi:hypothetical protein